jgi:hypothetical protein
MAQPHIDGAWPAAGLDEKTGEYLHEYVLYLAITPG